MASKHDSVSKIMSGSMDPFSKAAENFERHGVANYFHDPVKFAEECIDWEAGEGLTYYQKEIMRSLNTNYRMAVRGPHGLGKTTTAAVLILWFALTRDAERIDWKIITTAGAWRQLEQYLWPEVKLWANHLKWDMVGRKPFKPDVEMKKLSLELNHGHAGAVAATNPALIEGAHAKSLLYIFDESKSIHPDTFNAAEGAFSGAQNNGGLPEAYALASSTPGEPQGRFYAIHSHEPGFEDWTTRHVKKWEVVRAGRMSNDWAKQRKLQFGENSALYNNRVLGEFYASDEDGVVPLSWIEAAQERWHEWNNAGRPHENVGKLTVGVDVALAGGDLTVIAPRRGAVVRELVTANVTSTIQVASLAQFNASDWRDTIVVDNVGVGAGVVDQLDQNNRDVIPFSAAAKSTMKDRTGQWNFLNQRAAMWWTIRDLLDPSQPGGSELCLPPDPDLTSELVAPKWWITAGNRVQVESKDEIRKRIARSTDRADALGMCLFFTWDSSGGADSISPVYRYDEVDKAIASEFFGEDLEDDSDDGIALYRHDE